ncbi:MAG: hypothetical protein R6X22_01980 [Gemmatimonadota bacterium]
MRTSSRRSSIASGAEPGGARAAGIRRPSPRPRGGASATAGILFALAALPSAAAAQSPWIVDRGRFEVRIEGVPRGQESFAIRRQGAEYMAVGRISREGAGVWIGSAEIGLRTDGRFVPVRYEYRTLQRPPTRVIATRAGSRIRITTTDQTGERMTEIGAGPGLLLLQTGVVHHYWFLVRRLQGARAGEGGTVEAVTPADVRRMGVELASVEPDRVAGPRGGTIEATRYEIRIGDVLHRVWVESESGRVLRAEIPEQGWSAVRVAEATDQGEQPEGSEP